MDEANKVAELNKKIAELETANRKQYTEINEINREKYQLLSKVNDLEKRIDKMIETTLAVAKACGGK